MENASNVNVVGESPFTYGERIGVAVLILVIFIFGLIGNSIVILAVVLSKELQTVSNVFVVSLAVADLCYCLLLPLSNATALLAPDGWPFESEILCTMSALMAFYQCRGKHEQSRLHRHKPSSCNQRTNDGLHMGSSRPGRSSCW